MVEMDMFLLFVDQQSGITPIDQPTVAGYARVSVALLRRTFYMDVGGPDGHPCESAR